MIKKYLNTNITNLNPIMCKCLIGVKVGFYIFVMLVFEVCEYVTE